MGSSSSRERESAISPRGASPSLTTEHSRPAVDKIIGYTDKKTILTCHLPAVRAPPRSQQGSDMDQSLDDLIKNTRKEKPAQKKSPPAKKSPAAKKSPKALGRAPGGRKGKGQGGGNNAGDALMAAVNQSSKAKRAAKQAAARGMDIDLPKAPVVIKGARSKGGKVMVGKKLTIGKLVTLKDRMSAAATTLAGAMKSSPGPGTPTKAAAVKITIPGAAVGGGGKGGGKGKGKGRAPGGKGAGRGGIVMPGANKPKGGLGGAIQKARKVVVQAGGRALGRAPGGPKLGRGGKGRGKGRGKGGGRGGRQ